MSAVSWSRYHGSVIVQNLARDVDLIQDRVLHLARYIPASDVRFLSPTVCCNGPGERC